MKLIVGLGNPGKEYEKTRHNVGFMFLGALSSDSRIAPVEEKVKFLLDKKINADVATFLHDGEKVMLIKPQTFMNSSGTAVEKAMNYYGADINDLIVILDDIDLPVGKIRVRHCGSSGGHKGLESIIKAIDSDNFVRFRFGVLGDTERKQEIEASEYVLDQFSKREKPVLDQAISIGIDYLLKFLGSKEPIAAHTLEIIIDSLK